MGNEGAESIGGENSVGGHDTLVVHASCRASTDNAYRRLVMLNTVAEAPAIARSAERMWLDRWPTSL